MSTERKIDSIVFHCLDSPNYSNAYGFNQVNRWHADNGWKDPASGVHCGYHWIIKCDGTVEPGRPESSVGAHCKKGGMNKNSIGIAYAGRNSMTEKQIASLITLYGSIYLRHGITPDRFFGHREFDPGKLCPGICPNVLRELLRFRLKPQMRLVG